MAIDEDKLNDLLGPVRHRPQCRTRHVTASTTRAKGSPLERMGLTGKAPVQIRAHLGAPTADLAGAPATKS